MATVEFHPRYRRCELTGRERTKVKEAILQLPAAMTGQFNSLNISPIRQTRLRGVYRLKLPPFRVIFQVAGKRVFVLALERRDDNTYSHLDRLAYRRNATGVVVVEVPDPEHAKPAPREFRGRGPARRARPTEHSNPLMPFTREQLLAMGATDPVVARVRQLPESVDIGEALSEIATDAATVELLADAWHDPERYLAIFDEGRTPTAQDASIQEAELERRLASPDSSTSVAAVGGDELEHILSAPIDAWMWFLHPSQARTVRHLPTGPSRVRGGPGTGKTVAALHRARFLIREGFADRVLLTTFVRVLPATWRALLGSFAPDVADAITTKTVDAVAYDVVRDAEGAVAPMADEQRRLAMAEKALAKVGVERTPSWLLGEIDTVIVGRAGAVLERYLAVARTGRGSALARGDREAVFSAYCEYMRQLTAAGLLDFAELRLRAERHAGEGHGPRFDGIIVDEAQDLTELQIRLLMALDSRQDHRAFLLVGDGQQAIYPGGFSLRSAGLDVRGRSFVLHTNWRNSQRIADTAGLVLGDLQVADLEEPSLVARDEAPPRRLGVEPELHLVRGSAHSNEIVEELVVEALAEHRPEEIAVLGRKNKVVKQRAEGPCLSAGASVVHLSDLPRESPASGRLRVGTFEYSKGLEFKVVILVGPELADWSVSPFWIDDEADRQEWWLTERRKLFVAMTRARDRLVVVATPPLPGALERAAPTLSQWDWK